MPNGSDRCSSTTPSAAPGRTWPHHYDLSDDLYDLFLDPDRQYSCAYFDTPNHSLEQAQHAKKRHLASKLLLDRPGLSVLDIGSGWGGLGIYLHEKTGANVTGLTLSKEQQAYAAERAQKLGIQDHVAFHLRDYREDTGTYDRIVSVGMFEHVGVKHYVEFFRKVERLLKEDGVRPAPHHRPLGRAQASPTRGCASTSSPEVIAPRSPRCSPRWNRPA